VGASEAKLVHDFLEDSAARLPDKDAVFYLGKWHKYQEIEERANALAHLLIGLETKKGDRVALFIENSPEYVITYYAILKAGGITVALNTENTAADVGYIVRDCGVRFFVTNEKQFAKIGQALDERRPVEQVLLWKEAGGGTRARAIGAPAERPGALIAAGDLRQGPDTSVANPKPGIATGPMTDSPSVPVLPLPELLGGQSKQKPDAPLTGQDIASIVYTSGSTGKPRGATLSHLNIVSNVQSIVEYLRLTADDRIMVVLPFHYIYGKSLLNTHFAVGGSVVIDNRFIYPAAVLQTMREQAVTGFAGVPSTFTILLNRSLLKGQRFPSLRYVTQAGGAMAPAVQKEVARAFAPAKLFIMYGATEASARLSYLDPADLPKKWGSIGKAIPGVELFVADENGHPLGPGQQGEIVARGPNIMRGYWGQPEETKRVLRNGLYFTGDIGVMDEEGFLFVVGRTWDMIKVGGNRVSAKEIEEALYEHPAVAEAAVIGVPDDLLGEVPKAFVVLKPGAPKVSEEQFREFLGERVAPYKTPKVMVFADSLPKNEAGKIQKKKLR
jgi:long-chain acyl-CoA synthetase